MIYSGNLTERLDFYEIIGTQSASGFKDTVEQFKFSAKAQRMKNKEYYEENAEEMFHICNLTFKLRKRDIHENDIVCYRQERYRIISVDEYRSEQTITIQKINE